jgi:phosphoglycolate phosphatase
MGNLQKTQAVLFDLDGTLIDSLADLASSINRMLQAYGYPTHEVNAYRRFVGDGMRQLVQRALPSEAALDDFHVDEALLRYQAEYQNAWKEQTVAYDGIHDLIAELQTLQIPMAVISNKSHPFTQLCCSHFFPDKPFQLVLGARPEVPRKPDPAAARDTAQTLAVDLSACFYVGDSDVDMHFARAAGMKAVGVSWGFRGADELRVAGADFIIDSPNELLGILN